MGRTPLRRLVEDERGMTLMELLNVLVILGILLAIAVPSYLSLKDHTYQNAAKSNLRNVLPAVGQYALDNSPNSVNDPDLPNTTDSGYTGISETGIRTYDPTIDVNVYRATSSAPTTYCVYTWVNAWTAYQAGPGAQIGVTLNSSFKPATCS